MICDCGKQTENIHKVQRNLELVGEYQKCPACGRILWLWKSDSLDAEIKEAQAKGDIYG